MTPYANNNEPRCCVHDGIILDTPRPDPAPFSTLYSRRETREEEIARIRDLPRDEVL